MQWQDDIFPKLEEAKELKIRAIWRRISALRVPLPCQLPTLMCWPFFIWCWKNRNYTLRNLHDTYYVTCIYDASFRQANEKHADWVCPICIVSNPLVIWTLTSSASSFNACIKNQTNIIHVEPKTAGKEGANFFKRIKIAWTVAQYPKTSSQLMQAPMADSTGQVRKVPGRCHYPGRSRYLIERLHDENDESWRINLFGFKIRMFFIHLTCKRMNLGTMRNWCEPGEIGINTWGTSHFFRCKECCRYVWWFGCGIALDAGIVFCWTWTIAMCEWYVFTSMAKWRLIDS